MHSSMSPCTCARNRLFQATENAFSTISAARRPPVSIRGEGHSK
ncbi:hypothetical protein ALC57_11596 [Trachymyrmex cornetzi]|uniref:Uncharacterized protein n=1 Tax=Trachymyrmex cornetzi TaxID=471704 RepID=A0A151J298_9HYME|nr:hypothetical protein ALC57_11596 [Trachymyrmex cornetzi]